MWLLPCDVFRRVARVLGPPKRMRHVATSAGGIALGGPTVTQDSALRSFLEATGLMPVGGHMDAHPLPGGVSSDIYLVGTLRGNVVVKRALPRLKVDGVWLAPVERSAHEAAFLRVAQLLTPGLCPRLLEFDPNTGFIAMQYLDPKNFSLWKTQLLAGHRETDTAARVGDGLGRIHATSAADSSLADEFETTDTFRSLRLDPYFESLKAVHPDVAGTIGGLVDSLLANRRTLVHGDISPKNILVGDSTIVFLDAECAWWGDPAFDVAFCINHLLLKAFMDPVGSPDLMRCVAALRDQYLKYVDWEDPQAVLSRSAALLPALMLARVDGLSPVEYLNEHQREAVRAFALALLSRETQSLDEIVSGQLELTR